MNSERKTQTARANGALSHGPVTADGKQKSAQNSTRHGLLSNTIVLEGESKERFEELLASLTAELKPRNTTEAALVETMAVARWRWLRVLSIQKAELDIEMARECVPASKPARAATVFRKLADNSRVLDVLLRYETAFDRQFCRALNFLSKLRASEQPETTLPLAAAEQEPVFHDDETAHPNQILEFPNEPNPADSEALENGFPGSSPESFNVHLPTSREVLMNSGAGLS